MSGKVDKSVIGVSCISIQIRKKASKKTKRKNPVKPTRTPVNWVLLISTDYHILIIIQLWYNYQLPGRSYFIAIDCDTILKYIHYISNDRGGCIFLKFMKYSSSKILLEIMIYSLRSLNQERIYSTCFWNMDKVKLNINNKKRRTLCNRKTQILNIKWYMDQWRNIKKFSKIWIW